LIKQILRAEFARFLFAKRLQRWYYMNNIEIFDFYQSDVVTQ